MLAISVVRQTVVLAGIVRSIQFLETGKAARRPGPSSNIVQARPRFLILVPVLREARRLRALVDHFEPFLEHHDAVLTVITTSRETAERATHPDMHDTAAEAAQLAKSGSLVHFHCPDPAGIKGDQLNWAVDQWLSRPEIAEAAHETYCVIYDADSRPPRRSLEDFEHAIDAYRNANVFHQSSCFAVRSRPDSSGIYQQLAFTLCDSGALRANRFVLGYEIPRLLRSASRWRRGRRQPLSYTHVTGHGLCLRLSLLRDLPFPSRSPLEDMHYSFILGSRGEPMVPVPSLDHAEVPASLRVQFFQLVRWFAGPARFAAYLRDGRTGSAFRTKLLALSALTISMEWLSCAVAVPLLLAAVVLCDFAAAWLAIAFVAVFSIQLVVSEIYLGSHKNKLDRLGRLVAYPVCATLFGFAGIKGAIHLLRGRSMVGKTEG